MEERGKEKVEKWALMQEPASTIWWSIGRGTCMEVVRNQETHAGRSAAVKMIMASQIMGPHLSSSNSLSNHTNLRLQQPTPSSSRVSIEPTRRNCPAYRGEKAPPSTSKYYSILILYPWIAPWSKASKKRWYTCMEYTARPSHSRRTPEARSVWHAALRMERALYCIRTHMWDGN